MSMLTRNIRRWLPVLVAIASISISEASDPEIEKLEEAYRQEIIAVRADLGEKWLKALKTLQDQLTRAEKLDAAKMVRAESQRVQALLSADPLPQDDDTDDGGLTLLPARAVLKGGLRLSPAGKSISHWTDPGAAAGWSFAGLEIRPGDYEIIMHFQAGREGGGTFTVAVGDDQEFNASINSTPVANWDERRSMFIGNCSVSSLTGGLQISSRAHRGPLMDLLSIDLAPPGTWAEMQAEAANAESPAPDPAQAETVRLEGARLVSGQPAEAGVIVVEHQGEQYRLRPYFARMPRLSRPDSEEGKSAFTRYLKRYGTGEIEYLEFARDADRQMREMLAGKELTIYTRWETRGLADSSLAFILIDQRALSKALVEEGLATADGPASPFLPTEISPNVALPAMASLAFMSKVRQSEQEARNARRGLWRLGPR